MRKQTIKKNLNEISKLGLLTKLTPDSWTDEEGNSIVLYDKYCVVSSGKYTSKVYYKRIAAMLNKISGRLVFIDSYNICIIAMSLKYIPCQKDKWLW